LEAIFKIYNGRAKQNSRGLINNTEHAVTSGNSPASIEVVELRETSSGSGTENRGD
jgi:hypothetical protein